MSESEQPTERGDDMGKFIDLVKEIISDWKKFSAFVGLILLLLLTVWLVPRILHLSANKLTISSKGGEIEFRSATQDQDQYYLVVSPQAGWQRTHIQVTKGSKLIIVADGRVNTDFHGLFDQIERRIKLEEGVEASHPGLRGDPNHTPEEYFSEHDWQSLIPRHYWSGPDGDAVIVPTSFKGRQKYKLAPELSYGALVGTIMANENADPNGQPPGEGHDVFLVGSGWPTPTNGGGAPATGWLWLAVNDVVEPESAFPNAKGTHLSDMFLLDNLGFYRVLVSVPN